MLLQQASHTPSFGGFGLTRNGIRVGVYGDVVFPVGTSLPGNLTFIRCGVAETWQQDEGRLTYLGGLRISLLDGKAGPYNVLPLDPGAEHIDGQEMLEPGRDTDGCG